MRSMIFQYNFVLFFSILCMLFFFICTQRNRIHAEGNNSGDGETFRKMPL